MVYVNVSNVEREMDRVGSSGKSICLVCNSFWYLYNFRSALLSALKTEGYDIYLIAKSDEFKPKLEAAGYYCIDSNIDPNGRSLFNDFKTLFQYVLMLKKIKPFLVITFTIKPNLYATLAARLSKASVFNNVTGLGTIFIEQSRMKKVIVQMLKFSLSFSEKIFLQNEDDAQLFLDNKIAEEKQLVIVAGSGIDTRKFVPVTGESNQPKTVFLLVARLLKEKGIYEYIEAGRMLKEEGANVECWLCGSFDDNNPSSVSRDLVESAVKDEVLKYLGFSSEIQKIIPQADCIVLPSYREGTSRTLLEAGSMGKPLIAANVPGCKEIIDDGKNGFLCQVKDSLDLKEKMKEFVELDAESREQMGVFSRDKIVKEYDVSIVNDRYLSEIRRLT